MRISAPSSEASNCSVYPSSSWLDRPLSGTWLFVGWFAATTIFVGIIALLGGPTVYDSNEWIYSTWSIAHGNLAYAYPPASSVHLLPNYQPGPYIAPLWPLVSGGIVALAGIGHSVPFPSQAALGPHCSGAYLAMYRWAGDSLAQVPTLAIAYASWLALLGGAVALLRSCGRGRTIGELFALTVIACTPISWMPFIGELHPQDLLAMGLGLGGLACSDAARGGGPERCSALL